MVWRDALLMVAALVGLASLLVASLTYRRAGNWRESDAGRKVTTDLSEIDGKLKLLDQEVKAMPTKSDVGALRDRMMRVETKIDDLPNSAVVATLTEVSKSNHELLLITRAQLNRLEGFFYGDKT